MLIKQEIYSISETLSKIYRNNKLYKIKLIKKKNFLSFTIYIKQMHYMAIKVVWYWYFVIIINKPFLLTLEFLNYISISPQQLNTQDINLT